MQGVKKGMITSQNAPRAVIKLIGIIVSIAITACSGSDSVNPNAAAEAELNSLLQSQFPGGTMVTNVGSDTSVTVSPPAASIQTVAAEGAESAMLRGQLPVGSALPVSINYNSTGSDVTGMCVSFGDPNSAYCIPFSASGVVTSGDGQSGSATLMLSIPEGFCDDLGQICHDIKCYESAQTSIGTISRANLSPIASACGGGCDEPSCQDLLPMCEDGFDCGNGTSIQPSLVCNGTSNCSNGADEEISLCGSEVSCCIATNGCPEETGSSCGSTCCCCGAGEACDAGTPSNGCVGSASVSDNPVGDALKRLSE